MKKTEQVKALKNGNGVQYLLDEGHKIFKNPISIFDTEYNLIAYTDVFSDDPLWNELIKTGTFSIESQIFFMNECFTDNVANAKKLAMMKSDKLKYDRILEHIFNKNGIKVANMLMLECDEPFDADAIAAFELLADMVTDEIRNDEYYITYGETYQDAWINKLLNQSIKEKKMYSPHVQILYDGFKDNLYLSVVDIARSNSIYKSLKYYVDLFREKQPAFKYAIYNNYIVMIISTNYKYFSAKRELNDLQVYFEQENIFAGISSRFDNIFELNKYYIEAVNALSKLSDNSKHISIYNKSTL